ncbi:DDE-type integrase/transposase/recombinase [Paraburkholderia strydomiana]|uniref:DDE-type integrase/transposase/recombinase n=1 Tax=Paraburkholderia strydomiana TaxID=1245417 RepID=UPI0038BDF935
MRAKPCCLRTRRFDAQCLNNRSKQDHRNVKYRTNAMPSFKRFRNAATTVAGIELMHRIRKGRFRPNCLYLKDATMPTAWDLVLAARQGVLIWWR